MRWRNRIKFSLYLKKKNKKKYLCGIEKEYLLKKDRPLFVFKEKSFKNLNLITLVIKRKFQISLEKSFNTASFLFIYAI
jgi:hypothetical protein